MKISIASDHAGFELKAFLVEELRQKGFDIHDQGAHELLPDDDYPLYIAKVAKEVSQYEIARVNGHINSHTVHGEKNSVTGRDVVGIVIGGSGQGEAMVANKFPHIRAAVLYGGMHAGGSKDLLEKITDLSRRHNDANILSLGARFIDRQEALEMVLYWLQTPFEDNIDGARHQRRLREIDDLEQEIR